MPWASRRRIRATTARWPAENPLALAHYNQEFYKRNRSAFSTELRYRILDGLTAKVTGGLVINDQIYRYYRNGGDVGNSKKEPGDYKTLARARNDRDYNTEWLLEATLNYNKTLADKHTINAVAGYSMQTQIFDNVDTNGKNFTSDRIPEISGAGGELGDTDATTDRAAWSLMSYFGRAIYTYDNRYNLSVSMRADGCSRFGRDSRWGYFPSVSAGWTVSEEDFFSPAANFMSMKLRASWGVSGNNNIGNYRHIADIAQTYYVFGSEVVNAYYPSGFTDQELSWETTRQTNVGLDLGFFRDRLRLTGNYYYSVTRDLLYQLTTSAFTGSTSYWTNMEDGRVYNQGFDLQVDGAILAGKNWKWNMGFNVSLNRNKVMGLEDEVIEKAQRSQITHITRNGEPIGSYYGMVSQGIITKEDYDNILIDKQHQGEKGYELLGPAVNNYEEVFIGDVKWKDVNGDRQITEDDREIIGNNYPDFTFGLYTTVSYKGLSLSATFDGQYGADVINFSKYYIGNMEGREHHRRRQRTLPRRATSRRRAVLPRQPADQEPEHEVLHLLRGRCLVLPLHQHHLGLRHPAQQGIRCAQHQPPQRVRLGGQPLHADQLLGLQPRCGLQRLQQPHAGRGLRHLPAVAHLQRRTKTDV